jgi:hypothetical protein
MIIPEDWEYIGFRTDIHDHCQICDKKTNRLHWYQMNPQQVATVCEGCKLQSDVESKRKYPNIASKPIDWLK